MTWQMDYSVRSGQLRKVEELIDRYGLSYCEEWSSGYFLLRRALKYKHTEVAKLLVKRGAKISSKNKNTDKTLFSYAIKNGDAEIVEILLKNYIHCDLNLSKFLHHPVESDNIKIVEKLLQYGAYINFSSERGDAPLHIATEMNNKEMVLLLLSKQADVNIRGNCNYSNRTPLHIASYSGFLEIVKVLLNHGALINSDDYNNRTPLHRAVEGKHKDVVELLLNHGAKVDSVDNNSKSILCSAVQTRNVELIEIVLKHLPDVNKENNRSTLLTALCGKIGNENIVEVLIQYGFVIKFEDIENCHLIHNAIKNGYLSVVIDLITFGANVNMLFCERYSRESRTLLHTAVINNRLEIVQTLIKHGANVKLDNDLLHIAVEEDNLDMVELLLQYIDVNTQDRNGESPLQIAIKGMRNQNNYNDDIKGMILKLLLSKGANVNTQTIFQGTILITASRNGNIKAVEALLEYGAEVNAKQRGLKTKIQSTKHLNKCRFAFDYSDMYVSLFGISPTEMLPGQTALHLACKNGHDDVVKVLIEYGADVNITNSLGHTPLEYAAGSKVIELLEQQFVRMQTANLYLNSKNKLETVDNPQLKAFQNQCEEEIERMKKTKVSDSNISFYDILIKDNVELAICMKNDSVVETLRSDCYKEMFPIYRYMMHNNFKKAFERKQLIEQCVEIFPTLIFQELLPECVEKILTFLSNDELNNLIKDEESHKVVGNI